MGTFCLDKDSLARSGTMGTVPRQGFSSVMLFSMTRTLVVHQWSGMPISLWHTDSHKALPQASICCVQFISTSAVISIAKTELTQVLRILPPGMYKEIASVVHLYCYLEFNYCAVAGEKRMVSFQPTYFADFSNILPMPGLQNILL